ncbi:MAG: PspC domain-containing protein [Flavobacteriales bacterium]|nr:PspC domain-containing protein [Flavobacteriales bacterium]
MKKLTRSKGKIAGVCEGLGNYFNLDSIWFRIAFILTFPIYSFLIYILLWIMMENRLQKEEALTNIPQSPLLNNSNIIEKSIKIILIIISIVMGTLFIFMMKGNRLPPGSTVGEVMNYPGIGGWGGAIVIGILVAIIPFIWHYKSGDE